MRKHLYVLCQCTWGCVQTLLGLCMFLQNRHEPHHRYHGAVVTTWQKNYSISLGMFVFMTAQPAFQEKVEPVTPMPELISRLRVHEYGHTIQSLLLGPLYLIVIGIPSTVWGWLPSLNRKRQGHQLSYFDFFTESWANQLGEWVTGEKSMERLMID